LQRVSVYPVTLEIARLVGRLEGELATKGFAMAFEDLAIGVTALQLGFDVATLNVKHYKLILGLNVATI
jgi:predicted nucleic acid-binding protein